jgi:DNA-binding NtrC family response regulator
MMSNPATISIIDGDPSTRTLVRSLLESTGFLVDLLASAEDYLRQRQRSTQNCIVLDVQLRGRSELALQARLKRSRLTPLVFVTSLKDVASSVQAMKAARNRRLHARLTADNLRLRPGRLCRKMACLLVEIGFDPLSIKTERYGASGDSSDA